MADFLLLPPRTVVGEEIARLIRPFLPGVRITASDCVRFLDQLTSASGNTFLVHREELPDEEDIGVALRAGFGAEPGDRIVHVLTGRSGEPRTRVEAVAEALAVG